jgi:hypothetical protein
MNQILRETLATLNAAGFKPGVQHGKHIKVTWHDAAGRRHILVISISLSNRRALQRNRALLRRLLKQPTTRGA